jgi:hypothetical protein
MMASLVPGEAETPAPNILGTVCNAFAALK